MTTPHTLAHLLFLLDTAYDHVSWHGPNLRGSLRGVTPRQAAWRPHPDRHNVWELAVHAAYWKYAVWRRLTGARRGSFPVEGSNWIRRPQQATARAWREDLRLLESTHRELRTAVAALEPRGLGRVRAGGKVTTLGLVTGAAAHDLYHAGQVQILKRLMPR